MAKSCPPGQKYWVLFDSCLPIDSSGGTATTTSGNVPVKDEVPQNQSNGKFWDRAPDYIDSLANLWASIKGQPVQNNGSYQPYYQPQKDNSSTITVVAIVAMVFILIIALLFLRRKK